MTRFGLFTILALGLVGCNRPTDTAPSTTKADNTAVNERDRNSNTKTPIDQNENQPDIDTTASIRKRVIDAKLSVNAQNVKIITQDGKVTLRGVVETDDEKSQVGRLASAVAGESNVTNQLIVK